MKELNDFLLKLNLSKEETKIYLFLLQNEASTILDISKGIGINRTSLYRLCEKMTGDGYLRKIAEIHTTKYEAASIDFLKSKVNEIEQKSKDLQAKYKEIKSVYSKLESLKSNKIKVLHYTGKEEVKQLLWNYLSTKTEVMSFGYRTLAEAVGNNFIVRWWNEAYKRGIRDKLIANPGTFKMKHNVDKKTREKLIVYPDKFDQERIIDEKIFKIYYETFIYNDIYAIVQWDKKQVFGVEIYNKVVADQERAIFEVLWKMAKPHTVIYR